MAEWFRTVRFSRLTPKLRRFVVIGVVVVVVGGGAAVAWAATRPAGASYRVATAEPAWVVSSLAETGTIQPVTEATVTFPVSGQVSTVSATVGQQVTVGQTLAQLNTTSLNNTVSSDQSQVATAQAKLATDQTSQTAVSQATQTTSPSSSGSSGSGSSSHSSGTASKLTGLVQSLSGDQAAVRQAQQKVDSDLLLVTASVNAVTALGGQCQNLLTALSDVAKPTTGSTSSSASSSTSSSSPSTSSDTPAPPTSTTGVGLADQCTSAIDAALAAETSADKDEHTLTSAVAALSTALDNVVAAVGQTAASSGSGSSGSSSGSHSTGSTSNSGSGSRSGGSGGSQPASADQIAADQASVDAANAELAAAQQNLAAATMVSPIAGTVADVTVTAGDNASANSTTEHVVVIGPGQDEIMTAVNDNEVGQVKPGENATVTPDGATKPINGKVTSVGALASTASSGSASYPVTISLDSTSEQLFDGATASVSVTLSTAQAAVTVPTSAVTSIGRFSVVQKMVNGKPTLTRVTVGVVGATVTQVTSGLKVGDQVSLANMTEPMPTATNSFGAGRAITGGGGGAGFRVTAGGGAGGGTGGGTAGGAGAGSGGGNAKVVGGGG